METLAVTPNSVCTIVQEKLDATFTSEKLDTNTPTPEPHPDDATKHQELLHLEDVSTEVVIESKLSPVEDEQVVTEVRREEVTEVVVVPQVANVIIQTEVVREASISTSPSLASALAQDDSTRAKWKEIASEHSPPIDILELKDSYHVYAEVPGINVKDISIDLSNNLFTLTGDKRDHPLLSRKMTEGDVVVQEISKGRFKRVLELPDNVDTNDVDVEYEGGILQCKIRKLEEKEDVSEPTEEIEVQQETNSASEDDQVNEGVKAFPQHPTAEVCVLKPKRIKGGKKRSSCVVQ